MMMIMMRTRNINVVMVKEMSAVVENDDMPFKTPFKSLSKVLFFSHPVPFTLEICNKRRF